MTLSAVRPVERQPGDSRRATRCPLALPARLAWKDRQGVSRFASVVTRDMSETGVYVECRSPVTIPMYRLVQFQLEREATGAVSLPRSVRQGRVLSAVYRIAPSRPGDPQGLALRLLVDPKRSSLEVEPRRATA